MPYPYQNLAASLVATAPSPPTSGTSVTVTTGEGVLFADPATAGVYPVTLWPDGSLPTALTAEIALVTAKAGDVFTITRAQEGTTARSVAVGWRIAASLTAKWIPRTPALSLSGVWKSSVPQQSGSWSASVGLNTVYATPLMVWDTETWDRIGLNVAGAIASSVVRCGVYADNGKGYPGSLIADFGTLSAATTGDKTLTLSQEIPAGMVWLAGAVQGASGPNISVVQSTPPLMPHWVGASIPFGYGTTTSFVQTGVSGALPSTFTTTVAPTGAGCPRLWVRVA